jgi:hypothetical protein
MVRKVLFVALTTATSQQEPQVTVLLVLVLVFVFVVLNVKYQPFDEAELDHIELLSLMTSFFTLFFGLFFVVPDVPHDMSSFATYAIIGLNIVTLMYLGYTLFLTVLANARNVLETNRSKQLLKTERKRALKQIEAMRAAKEGGTVVAEVRSAGAAAK